MSDTKKIIVPTFNANNVISIVNDAIDAGRIHNVRKLYSHHIVITGIGTFDVVSFSPDKYDWGTSGNSFAKAWEKNEIIPIKNFPQYFSIGTKYNISFVFYTVASSISTGQVKRVAEPYDLRETEFGTATITTLSSENVIETITEI